MGTIFNAGNDITGIQNDTNNSNLILIGDKESIEGTSKQWWETSWFQVIALVSAILGIMGAIISFMY